MCFCTNLLKLTLRGVTEEDEAVSVEVVEVLGCAALLGLTTTWVIISGCFG